MTKLAKKICILGGGFGGLYTALRLTELSWEGEGKPEITLVDKNDRFLFSPLLYELITEELQTWEIAPSYSDLLANTEINFIQDQVTAIDTSTQKITLANHSSLDYNRLAIALGASTPIDMVKGAKEYAFPFRSLQDAYKLKERLRNLENSDRDKIRVVVVGGGYNGIEISLKIADRLGNRGKVRIVDRGEEILKDSTDFNRQTAKKVLEKRNIWLDLETEIDEIEADSISLIYKGKIDKIPVDVVLWTVGTKSVKLIDDLSLPQNQEGKLKTNQTLQLENHPEIFAIGDLAQSYDSEGKKLPANAQVAFQQADYCAWNMWASLENKPLLPFKYQNLGEMLTLGSDDATISGLGLQLDGNSAYLARRLIYLYRLPTLKHKMSVGLNWLLSPVLSLFE